VRVPVEARGALVFVLLAIAVPVTAQHAPTSVPTRYAGRPLTDVLQTLQARGLRIIFTSKIVTPDMRVRVEPRDATPRAQLDEILAPHGLEARKGPGGTLQIVRAPGAGTGRDSSTPPENQDEAARANTAPLRLYDERITVTSPLWWQPASGVSEETVIHRELTSLTRDVVDDPLRAIQSMPRVAPLGDFRSEFVVRASPFRHAEVVVDGVSTSWLRHAPDQSASVSMFITALVDSATLRTGAYPRTYGDHLGPQLELTLREGSRDRVHVQGTVANSAATLVAEGPVGEARGSWITATRLSMLEWPGEHLQMTRPFGFSDAMGKLVFDANPRHQLGFSVLAGRSRVDAEEDGESLSSTAATAHSAAASMTWRSLLGPATVITHRAAVIRQGLVGEGSDAANAAIGADAEMTYRGTIVKKTRFGVLESGAQVSRTTWQHDGLPTATSWTRAGYVHLEAQGTERLTISPGVRVSGASHVAGTAVSPWLLGEFRAGRRWTISASTGLSHQFPDMGDAARLLVAADARAESAVHVDVGVRHQVTSNVHWGATVYQRRERGVFDEHEGSLAGSARGIEIVVERRSSSGLSGWGGYTYGRARQSDGRIGETFSADFDQRHSITAFGAYRWRDTTSVGATLRIGSGVPIPGYLSYRSEGLFLSDQRNEVRLPSYARLDVRADRAFQLAGRRFQGFVEVVNVLDRTNVGPAVGTFGIHGEAIGFVERLAPRRASAGVTFGF
jgi:hypothetical protein